ncbi:anti-anti-sigma factor [Actinoplanes sp. TRM 88003]|uniref:Anti-anti-sigma factor n=1 Tax=Paractinoplanes aksuensis TaxID=2939490 RepID=A0ABT1DN37_9ACTN|nr:anti-anti-sigma factor [Actinoplanes aksuensis]MCO8272236.1 anti-anti-sigma factor [Actinoplanes aksuensis]
MASEVRHRVDRGSEYPLVRLTGVLDAATAHTARSVLLGVLAEQPEAVLVDVGEVVTPSPAGAAMLRELRRDTADWPAAHLALCDPRGAAAWPDAGWPIWPGPDAARAELGGPDPDQRHSLALDPVVGAARRSRELITEACGRWDRQDLAGPACIVVTELVNNVVVHARTPMNVLLATHGSGISVAVRDHSTHRPTYTGGPVPPTAYGGRGMLLIDSVSERWGNLPLDDGKVVWALLSAEDGDETAATAGMTGPGRG